MTNKNDSPFAFVPEKARGCMTDAELESALREMNLDPAMEQAVREVCRNGFVIVPELQRGEETRYVR